jgi:reactive intermediate/imine deaminase
MDAIFTDRAPAPGGFYSQAVRAGQFLFISGQLPITSAGKLVTGTAAEQTKQTMDNVTAILEAAGGSIRDLVQVTVYITSIDYWPEVNQTYQAYLGDTSVPPARAVVPVKELHYGALVEIQAVAHLT